MTSIKKTDCPLLRKGVNTSRKTVTLETKILVISNMEASENRANVCSSLGLAPAAVTIIMANTKKKKTVDTENYKIARIKCKLH